MRSTECGSLLEIHKREGREGEEEGEAVGEGGGQGRERDGAEH